MGSALEFKVKEESYNPLLKRKELFVEVNHTEEGTPSRVDLRIAVAEKYGAKPESVYVIGVNTKTGSQQSFCQLQVYDDTDNAKKTIPKHLQTRNLPAEERKRMKEQRQVKKEAKPKETKTKKTEPKAPTEKPAEPKPAPRESKTSEVPPKSKESESK